MRLSKIKIENFRSIKDLEFEVPNLCVLVGENNTGKSNILEAIDWLLNGERWPLNIELKESDFFNRETEKPIKIIAWFSDLSQEEIDYFRRSHRNVMKQSYAQVKKGEKLEQENLGIGLILYFDNPDQSLYCFVDRKGLPIVYGQDQIRRISTEDRNFFNFVYVPALRDVGKEFSGYSWTTWNKLLKIILKTLDDRTKSQIKEYFRQSARVLRTPQLEHLQNDLKRFAKELLPKNEADLEIEISPFDMDDLYKNAEIFISDPIRTSLKEKGMGVQSTAIVALYRTYAKWSKKQTIFGIEEPELFLHPHNLRLLYHTFEDMADKGNTVIFATHSPFLIRYDRPSTIITVRKNENKETMPFQITSKDIEDLENKGLVNQRKIGRFFNAERNEMFFARKVILVEGDTDKYGILAIAKNIYKRIELDKIGISVIEVGGKLNLVDFVTILKRLKIASIVVFDEDRDNRTIKGNSIAVNDYLKNTADKTIVFSPNLEAVFLRHDRKLITDYLKEMLGENRIRKTVENYLKQEKAEDEAYITLLKNDEIKVRWLADISERVRDVSELPKEIQDIFEDLMSEEDDELPF
jgi:predicted ATP-dependent endonuclease of OLD family